MLLALFIYFMWKSVVTGIGQKRTRRCSAYGSFRY